MRYLLGFLATIGLLILILVLLLRGGDSAVETKALNLADYARTDSVAQLTIDGPVTSNSTHEEVTIDVSSDEVVFSLYKGYEGELVNRQSYPNNTNAYTEFLYGLQHEGFTKGNTDPAMKDERGVCPLGQTQVYSFENEGKQLMRFWSTSCGTKTFHGKTGAVINLFQHQVPDYNKLISGTSLSSSTLSL